MIAKDARGRRYRLSFKYECRVDALDRRRWITRAVLVPLGVIDTPAVDQWTKVRLDGAVVGTAVCSASDQFCKATGREIALDRCLGALEKIASRQDAAAIRRAWDERFSRPRPRCPSPTLVVPSPTHFHDPYVFPNES